MRHALARRIPAVLALVLLVPATAAQAATLTGRVMNADDVVLPNGILTITDFEAFYEDVAISPVGTFEVEGIEVGTTYEVQYVPTSGTRPDPFNWTPVAEDLDNPDFVFQRIGNTMRPSFFRQQPIIDPIGRFDDEDERDSAPRVVWEPSRFLVTTGPMFIVGQKFNGTALSPSLGLDSEFEGGIGWSLNASYLIPVTGRSGFERDVEPHHDRYWAISGGYAFKTYDVPQLYEAGAKADVSYQRFSISAGAHWVNNQQPLEYGAGLMAGFGGIYDGSTKVSVPEGNPLSGDYSILTFGIYGTGGWTIPRTPLQLIGRIEVLTNSGSQDPEIFRGFTSGFSLGIGYR